MKRPASPPMQISTLYLQCGQGSGIGKLYVEFLNAPNLGSFTFCIPEEHFKNQPFSAKKSSPQIFMVSYVYSFYVGFGFSLEVD
jgi:hypothetical protein